jgi:hypothetical protein
VVIALPQAIEQSLGEGQTQALVRILLQLHHVVAAVWILHLQHQLLLAAEHLQINQVAGADAIDAEQAIAGLEAQLLADGARLDAGDDRRLGKAGLLPPEHSGLGIGQGNAR